MSDSPVQPEEELDIFEDTLFAVEDEANPNLTSQRIGILPLEEINQRGLSTVLEEKSWLDKSDGNWIKVANRSLIGYNVELSVPDMEIYLIDTERLKKKGKVPRRANTFIASHNPNNVALSSIHSWPAENFHAGHLIPLSSVVGLPKDRFALSSHLVLIPQDPVHNICGWLAIEMSNNYHIKRYESGVVKAGAIFDKRIDGSSTEVQFIGKKKQFAVPKILYSSTLVYCSEIGKYLRSTWITENKEMTADMLTESLSLQAHLSKLGISELFTAVDYLELTLDSRNAYAKSIPVFGSIYDEFMLAIEKGCRGSARFGSTITGPILFGVNCANPGCEVVYTMGGTGFKRSTFGGKLGLPRCKHCAVFYSLNEGQDRQISKSVEFQVGMSLAIKEDPIRVGIKCANPGCEVVYTEGGTPFHRSTFGGKLGLPRCHTCAGFYSLNKEQDRVITDAVRERFLKKGRET